VFLALPDTPVAATAYARLQSQSGVRTAGFGSRLFADGIERIWEEFQRPSDVGLGPMVSSAEFLAALRGLADDLLAPAGGEFGVVVEWSPQHATPRAVAAMVSLFPEATIVVAPELARALPPAVAASVTTSVPEVLPAMRTAARPRTADEDDSPL